MTEPIIELMGLTKRYDGHTAVDRLTLTINRGEVFGLLGPNGAGKSTTILMMLGLTEPSMGIAKVCGIDATRNPMQVKKRVGYMPDDVGFYEDRTGLENLMYTAMLNRVGRREARSRAVQLLERVGLTEAANRKVGAYSRGMRQRLGLADVLIKQPDVIILDEPTLGIDPEGVRELLQLIRRLSRDEGITVLLSSHHLHQVQQICDRVGLFVAGRLIACGNITELSSELFAGDPFVVEATVSGGDTGSLVKKLEAEPGISRVEAAGNPDDGQTSSDESVLRIYCNQEATSSLAGAIVEAGAALLGLHRKQYGLDEIYHRYFEGRGSA